MTSRFQGSTLPLTLALVAASLGTWPTDVRAADAGFPGNEELRHVRSMSEPRLSADGTRVLVQVTDATADGGRSHLWLVDVRANAARQITWSPEGDKRGEHDGQWLGEGNSVLFLARREDRTRLYRLPMSGGEAHAYDLKVLPPVDASAEPDALPPRKPDEPAGAHEPLTLEPDSYEPAPDGRRIAIIAGDPETPGEKKQKDSKADARSIDHDPHGKRLYLVDADSGKLTPVAVAPDVFAVSWPRQSDRVVALANAPNDASDLAPAATAWLVQASDPAHAVQLKELPPTIERVSWSEDGSRLYFLAQATREAPPGYLDVYSLRLSDRAITNLTPEFGGSILAENPLPVGGEVIQGAHWGFHRGYVRAGAGQAQPIRFDSAVVSGLSSDGRHTAWVWLGQSNSQPNALYYAQRLGGAARVLNTPPLLPGSWPSAVTHSVRWSNEGLNLEGLLYLPADLRGGKVPLIVDVHGGPTGAWQDTFDPLPLFLLGQGWAVLRINPRGSTGYGAAFAAANKDDLGGGDYRDIMTGVDAVIARYPIDADRLALMGYSYGGEMAGFVEGKTDRFKAIVSGAPVIDQQSEYGTERGSWYDRWFYGKPWEHAEAAWRQSPLAGVAHARTPFLLIQGQSDGVDPPGQSQEMFRALRQQGVQVEYIEYPREDHGPLSQGMHGQPSTEPWHGFDARQRLVKFIKAAFETRPPR